MNRLKAILFALVGICCVLALHSAPALPQPSPSPQPSPPKTTGFSYNGSGVITNTRFVGECPGNRKGSVTAWFMSPDAPPAPGLRVVVTNTSVPSGSYTDRAYDRDQGSESFTIQQGTHHDDRYLAVKSNSNTFAYEIKQGDKTIGAGYFTEWFRVDVSEVNRSSSIEKKQYCLDATKPLANCPANLISTRQVRVCPAD